MKWNSRYFSSKNKNVKVELSTIKQFPVRQIYIIFNSLSSKSSLSQNNLKVNSNIGNTDKFSCNILCDGNNG